MVFPSNRADTALSPKESAARRQCRKMGAVKKCSRAFFASLIRPKPKRPPRAKIARSLNAVVRIAFNGSSSGDDLSQAAQDTWSMGSYRHSQQPRARHNPLRHLDHPLSIPGTVEALSSRTDLFRCSELLTRSSLTLYPSSAYRSVAPGQILEGSLGSQFPRFRNCRAGTGGWAPARLPSTPPDNRFIIRV